MAEHRTPDDRSRAGQGPTKGRTRSIRRPVTAFSTVAAELGRAVGFGCLSEQTGIAAGHITRCARPAADKCLTGSDMVALDAVAIGEGLGFPFLATFIEALSERAGYPVDALFDRLAKDLEKRRAR